MSLPDRKAIKDLFEGLLGRDIAIGEATAVTFDLPRPVVATYVDDSYTLLAVALMDLPLAAHSGAAIALVPKGGAEAAVEDSRLPPNLFDNAAEILNVLAAPIGEHGGVPMRLSSTFAPGETVPPQVEVAAVSLGARQDVGLDISGYGSGRLSIVLVPGTY
jgi:hypothetical protein